MTVVTIGCPAYQVEVDPGAYKCMTQAEYNAYKSSHPSLSLGDYIGLTAIVSVFLVSFITGLWAIRRTR